MLRKRIDLIKTTLYTNKYSKNDFVTFILCDIFSEEYYWHSNNAIEHVSSCRKLRYVRGGIVCRIDVVNGALWSGERST